MLLSTLKITSSQVSFTNGGFIWRSQLIQLIHIIAKISSFTPKLQILSELTKIAMSWEVGFFSDNENIMLSCFGLVLNF